MNQMRPNPPVSVGDDGRNATVDPDDGPLLTALKRYFTRVHDDFTRAMDAQRLAFQQALFLSTPNVVPLLGSGTAPSSGSVFIDLGSPQQGRRWLVRSLMISAASAAGDSMGSAVFGDWYVGQLPPATGNAMPNSLVATLSSTARAAVQTYTSEVIFVQPSDHLYVGVSRATSGVNIVAKALVKDYALANATGPAIQVV